MTNKDIQQLIDRYLKGETSPEEEKVLARELLREDSSPARGEVAEGRRGGSPEWQAIRLMLGELAMGEAEYDAMMAMRQQAASQKAKSRITSMKWRWTAAAASLLLLIGAGTMLLMKKDDTMLLVKGNDTAPLVTQKTAQPLPVAEDLKSATQQTGTPQGTPLPLRGGAGVGSVASTQQVSATAMNHQEKIIQTPPRPTGTPPLEGRGVAAPSPSAEVSDSPVVADLKSATQETGDFKSPSTEPSSTAEDSNLHYASLETNTDTIPYQDPARVDEFIEKLAAYYEVKQGELECSQPVDSTVVSTVYVFPDKKEIDVFSRLLQVACWYSDETPGYLLNFSHLQFFFQLKDMRHQLQYLWIAERVNGKILLYSTCSPIDAIVSSACYQEYRDELMHTKSIHTKTLDI